jgi:hypothetical protein
MSERAEQVFAKMESGKNVSDSINSNMDLKERGDLMKKICGSGTAAADGTVKSQFGDLEIVCKERTAANGAKTTDIVDAHKGTTDIYDQPSRLELSLKALKNMLTPKESTVQAAKDMVSPKFQSLRDAVFPELAGRDMLVHPKNESAPKSWIDVGTRTRPGGNR